MKIGDWDFQPAQGTGHMSHQGCAGLSSFSSKANRQLPDDLFSPVIDSPFFFFFPKPFHSTLSSKQTAQLCNTSKHRQQMKYRSCRLKKAEPKAE